MTGSAAGRDVGGSSNRRGPSASGAPAASLSEGTADGRAGGRNSQGHQSTTAPRARQRGGGVRVRCRTGTIALVTFFVVIALVNLAAYRLPRSSGADGRPSSVVDGAAATGRSYEQAGIGAGANKGGEEPRPQEPWTRAGRIAEKFRAFRGASLTKTPKQGTPAPAAATVVEQCSLPTPHAYRLCGQKFNAAPLPPISQTWSPRGIVIAGSGAMQRLAVGTYITCHLIRKVFKSTMPIEVFYVGAREAFSPEILSALEALGDVTVRDLVTALDKVVQSYPPGADVSYPYLHPTVKTLASYAAKPYAVLASSFRENILFDAGAMPFLDPVELFDLPSYQHSRFAEFRDYVVRSHDAWQFMPQEFCVEIEALDKYLLGTESDSSCVLIDKVVNWEPLVVTAILNAPLQDITYKKLNGDKETWLVAMAYMQKSLRPLETVPGFLFIDALGNGWGRKIHGQIQLLKVNQDGGGVGPGESMAGLVPLYLNNQLFNFTHWDWHRHYTYVGTFDDYGSLYFPPTSLSTDCRGFRTDELFQLAPPMVEAFDGVVEALRTIKSEHCACRDDWPGGCIYYPVR